MEKIFEKKVLLTSEEVIELREEVYSEIRNVKRFEEDLGLAESEFKSNKKKVERDIEESVVKQRNNVALLDAGYRLVQVECQEIIDNELATVITLEISNGEKLNVKRASSSQGSMGFDHYSVATIESKEALVAIIKKYIDSYGEAPIRTVEIELEGRNIEYFVFKASDGMLRVIRGSYEPFPTEESFKLTLEVITSVQEELINSITDGEFLVNPELIEEENPFI